MKELWNRLRAAWENFSPRERALLSIVATVFALLILTVAVVNPIVAASQNAHERVMEAERQMAAILRLRREYDEIHARLDSVERMIRSGKDKTGLPTLLESLASRSAVKIDSMEERPSPDTDRYRQTRVDVALKNVTLTQTVNYLHNIESADRVLSVKSLRIKSSRGRSSDQAELLDVSFTVSSFEPL